MRTLDAWVARVRQLLGNVDPNELPDNDVEEFVRAAVRKFSTDRPRQAYADFTGNGVTFDFTLPSAWVMSFSEVVAVECPTGARPPSMIDVQEVSLYPPTSAPTTLRLASTTPGIGQVCRFYYTAPWPIPDATAATDLIGDIDFEPVVNLAAAGCARQLQAEASGHTRASLPSADLSGQENEDNRWRNVARDCMKVYTDHIGAGDTGEAPASGMLDWDAQSTFQRLGRRFLFHYPRR